MISKVIRYGLALAVSIALLWLVFRQVDMGEMFARLQDVDYTYVYLSIGLGVLGFWVRAYRWKLLLTPLGFPIRTERTLLAVIIGYFANLFLPRMGEITRCGVLKRTDNVNLTVSIGSVVAERVVDLFTLLAIILLNLILEYDLVKEYFNSVFEDRVSGIERSLPILYMVVGVLAVLLAVTYLILRTYRARLRKNILFLKIRRIMKEVGLGLTSIMKLENQFLFWGSTVLLWSIYYTMTYIVVFAIPETAQLGIVAGVTILATGSIGMATPVQGGIGAFHALVSGVLVLYGIVLEDGILFATVLHTSQVLSVIAFGSLSLVITVFIKRIKHEGIGHSS